MLWNTLHARSSPCRVRFEGAWAIMVALGGCPLPNIGFLVGQEPCSPLLPYWRCGLSTSWAFFHLIFSHVKGFGKVTTAFGLRLFWALLDPQLNLAVKIFLPGYVFTRGGYVELAKKLALSPGVSLDRFTCMKLEEILWFRVGCCWCAGHKQENSSGILQIWRSGPVSLWGRKNLQPNFGGMLHGWPFS